MNFRRASVVFLALCAAACGGVGAGPASPTEGTGDSDVTQSATYKLGNGDKIRIKVYGVDQIGGEFDIDLSGSIDALMIGPVQADGRTIGELRTEIANRLRQSKLVEDPQVTVELVAAHPFYVLGEVERSGEYPYRAGVNVISAVATAGGFRYRADQDKVYIRRRGQAGEIVLPTSSAAPVYPGDIVRVPGRFF